MKNRRNKPSRVRVFRLEDLETREMLSAHGLGGGFSQWAAATQAAGEFTAHSQEFASLGAFASGHDRTFLTATLTDADTGEKVKLAYKTYTNSDGATETEFRVKVMGAAADTTLDVSIGGTMVGQITTDSNGRGALKLSSDPDDGEQSLPDNFPTDIAAGTAVSVGSLSGTLGTRSFSHSGCLHAHTALGAMLVDTEGTATGTATYRSTTKHDTTTTTLKVAVSGATASTSLEVAIDGTAIGQLATDANGAGSTVFSTNPKTGEVQATFPSGIAAGSKVTVGTLSGTLAADSTGDSSALSFSAMRLGRHR